jgi:broad specificity phosphatase PhoE
VTTTIFFVRHGSHDRLSRVLCGRMAGVTLSDAGHAEAKRAGERLARERLAAVYTSPLERTRETAEVLAQATGLTAETDADLIEVDYGAWTGATFETLGEDPRWRAWNAARGVSRTPGGESLLEVQARMRRFVDQARARHPDARIAAVSHGDPIKSILAHATGLPLDNLDRLEVSPASVSVLVAGDWGMKVFSINEAQR